MPGSCTPAANSVDESQDPVKRVVAFLIKRN